MLEDGIVVALDVTVIGDGENAAEAIRRKERGWGTLGALEKARREREEQEKQGRPRQFSVSDACAVSRDDGRVRSFTRTTTRS